MKQMSREANTGSLVPISFSVPSLGNRFTKPKFHKAPLGPRNNPSPLCALASLALYLILGTKSPNKYRWHESKLGLERGGGRGQNITTGLHDFSQKGTSDNVLIMCEGSSDILN